MKPANNSSLDQKLLQAEAAIALNSSGCQAIELRMPLVLERLRIAPAGTVYAIDADDQPRQGRHTLMTAAEFVSEIKQDEKFARLWDY